MFVCVCFCGNNLHVENDQLGENDWHRITANKYNMCEWKFVYVQIIIDRIWCFILFLCVSLWINNKCWNSFLLFFQPLLENWSPIIAIKLNAGEMMIVNKWFHISFFVRFPKSNSKIKLKKKLIKFNEHLYSVFSSVSHGQAKILWH